MHDTLAHRISLVAVQAAALQVDAPDAETADSARLIRESAHAALGELRDVLGVLHEDGTSGEAPDATSQWDRVGEPAGGGLIAVRARTAPSGVAQIPGLLEQWRQAGIVVDHAPNPEIDGVLPNAVSRAAFRVVQEGITNVARHAPQAQAELGMALHGNGAGGSELRITISNGPGAPGEAALGAGLGLVGLAERVRLLGGTLDHGRTGAGFRLAARIPFNTQPQHHRDPKEGAAP